MRLLKEICVIAIAICLIGGVAYAETQSVKISGDLIIRSFFRGDYDLNKNHEESNGNWRGAVDQSDWQKYFMTNVELQVDADLTDNVAGVIRLYNQREWNVAAKTIFGAPMVGQTTYLPNDAYNQDNHEFAVAVDLAYIELKEFLYSPLTLKIGRQDLWFGRGFIVGANFRDVGGALNTDEYSASTGFDAIRGTLDYDPWTIDIVAAQIWENMIGSDDDEDLFGVNVGYIFDVYNAEAETYWFYKRVLGDESMNVKDGNTINTVGLRGSLDPIENLTVAVEGALQWGQYVGSRTQLEKRDRTAYALDLSVESRHFQEQYTWQPKFGVEYIFYSGNKNIDQETPQSTGTYTGWDVMYRGKFDSAIRDFMGTYYVSAMDMNNRRQDMTPVYPDAAVSNQHSIIVMGSIQPTDSLTVDARYLNFWQQYNTYHIEQGGGLNAGARINDDEYLGSEIDIEFTWDYTEDVSFGLLAAWFFPGAHYFQDSDDVAHDIVGSVKLSF